mmetsp:Transcript_113888/g.254187  ORF Transcript_113888/g.254187 Transcript_113888/m.254187 type:complete len:201 (+) Transcript_113888:244-846(+)
MIARISSRVTPLLIAPLQWSSHSCILPNAPIIAKFIMERTFTSITASPQPKPQHHAVMASWNGRVKSSAAARFFSTYSAPNVALRCARPISKGLDGASAALELLSDSGATGNLPAASSTVRADRKHSTACGTPAYIPMTWTTARISSAVTPLFSAPLQWSSHSCILPNAPIIAKFIMERTFTSITASPQPKPQHHAVMAS